MGVLEWYGSTFIKLLESIELGMAFIDNHFHIHKMSNHIILRIQGRELGSFFLNFKNMKEDTSKKDSLHGMVDLVIENIVDFVH